MAYFNHAFVKVFLGFNGTLKQSGHSGELPAGQLGLFSAKTSTAITSANSTKALNPQAFLAQGSLYSSDKIGNFHGGYKESVKSKGINPAFVNRFWKVEPKAAKQHVIQIGYNGAVACPCPKFEKDKLYQLRIDVKGSPALRAYTRNLYRTFGVHTGCPEECTDNCVDYKDPKKVMAEFVAQINDDPQLKDFIKAELVKEGLTTAPAGSATFTTFTGTKCDEGSLRDLTAVQNSVGSSVVVTILSRDGANTTYQAVKAGGNTPKPDETLVTWTATKTSYKLPKDVCIKVSKASGATPSNLSAIQAAYPGAVILDLGEDLGPADGPCVEIFKLTILSDNLVDIACEGIGSGKWTMPQSYKGLAWEECPCVEEAEDLDQCVGIRLTGAYTDDKFSNCSFNPSEHFELQPIEIFASFVNDDGEVCNYQAIPVTQIQTPRQMDGTGEQVLRDLMLDASYRQEYFDHDPRMREVNKYPYLDVIKRDKLYKKIYILHSVPRFNNPSGQFDNDQYLLCLVFEAGTDTSTLETQLLNYFTSAGGNIGLTLETL